MKSRTQLSVPALPKDHLRTLGWMFTYSKTYLRVHSPGLPSEKAMALADVESFLDWLNHNWPQENQALIDPSKWT